MDKIKFDFKNRTAVITGGAQGFGLDIAKKFLSSGAKVNLWDIDKAQLNKAKKIGINLKGIITVGLFGQPSDMDRIKEIAALNNLWVFDDAAQSFGAKYKDKISLEKEKLRNK